MLDSCFFCLDHGLFYSFRSQITGYINATYSMLKYSSLQTGTLKLGMLWIGGYLNLPQLITDYHDRHPLVTCHLDVEGSKTLFHMLKARDLHAIFIIGSEKHLLNQSV